MSLGLSTMMDFLCTGSVSRLASWPLVTTVRTPQAYVYLEEIGCADGAFHMTEGEVLLFK